MIGAVRNEGFRLLDEFVCEAILHVDALRPQFHQLSAEWKTQAESLSSPTAIAALPAYIKIVEMGLAVVPLILDELRREPDHWFVALKRITGEDPAPEEAWGDVGRMAEAWLSWGREHGIRFELPTTTRVPATGPR